MSEETPAQMSVGQTIAYNLIGKTYIDALRPIYLQKVAEITPTREDTCKMK